VGISLVEERIHHHLSIAPQENPDMDKGTALRRETGDDRGQTGRPLIFICVVGQNQLPALTLQIPSQFFLHPIGYFENRRAIPHATMPTITHSRELVSTSKPSNIHRVHAEGAPP